MNQDDIPVQNKARDKAWEAFIKRKDVRAFMNGMSDLDFPLDGSYQLWCMAWEKAWDAGFKDGWDSGMAVEREACARMAEECVNIERLADDIRARGEK